MTRNFEGLEYDRSARSINHFELLSAYIDGELSAVERNQVQTLLDRDPQCQHLYRQLLTLQGRMQHSPAPTSEKSVAEITAGVFHSLDRKRRQRRIFWGGSAIAASIVALWGTISGTNPAFRIAERQNSVPPNSGSVMLAVALNKPAIDIPKSLEGNTAELNLLENY